jgi:hypothetical protein
LEHPVSDTVKPTIIILWVQELRLAAVALRTAIDAMNARASKEPKEDMTLEESRMMLDALNATNASIHSLAEFPDAPVVLSTATEAMPPRWKRERKAGAK